MHKIIIFFSLILVFGACKKDKFTTAPQITYKSVSPNAFIANSTTSTVSPVLTINVTDAEGDLGFKDGSDTSKIFIKSLLTNQLDSLLLPSIGNGGFKKFQADIQVELRSILSCRTPLPPAGQTRTDTVFVEVYITDFAKNKSNVLKVPDPVYLRCR